MRRSAKNWLAMSLVVSLIALAQTIQLAADEGAQRNSPRKTLHIRFDEGKTDRSKDWEHIPVRIVERRPNGVLVFTGSGDIPFMGTVGVYSISGRVLETDVQPNGVFSSRHVTELSIEKRYKKEVSQAARAMKAIRMSATYLNPTRVPTPRSVARFLARCATRRRRPR
jgi:hypothetical protein